MGQYMRSLPIVAIVVFAVSYFDALFLLPAHLNKVNPVDERPTPNTSIEKGRHGANMFARGLELFRDKHYLNCLQFCLNHKYSTLTFSFGLVFLAFTWFDSGRIDFRWYPQVPSDRVSARLTMPVDTSFEDTLSLSRYIEQAGLRTAEELGSIGDISSRDLTAGFSSSTTSRITITLNDESKRGFTQRQFANLWRKKVGDLPQVKTLQFDYLAGFGRSRGVYLDMHHESTAVLEKAATSLAHQLSSFDGVYDISDGLSEGKPLYSFTLTDEAKSLGITESLLGSQLQAAFFGAEALRYLRDDELIKVWVRLPEEEKNSLDLLHDFIIRAPDGTQIPLSQAATSIQTRTMPQITRINGRKNITVGGLLDAEKGNRSLITKTLEEVIIPDMKAQYPGLELGFAGTLTTNQSSSPAQTLMHGFIIACVVMFTLVASLFRSYAQGMVVLLTIPFCLAAALVGHVIMGFSLTSNSLFGMVALSGVVINGALVLTSKLNKLTGQGEEFSSALLTASLSRFRAIVLTSLTTTIGLIPMLMETSEQALFLVPFAIALTFGSLMSTVVVLIIIPCCHGVLGDLKEWKSTPRLSRHVT